MTIRRAVVYVGGASLLAAWFSSAASLSLSPRDTPPASDVPDAATPVEQLAVQIEEQSQRLRQRLEAAPLFEQAVRNPFAFREAPRPPAQPRSPRVEAPALAVPAEPPEPSLALIGVAEQRRGDATVRTAMLSASGTELILVEIGQGVLQRYQVTAVSAEAVELLDQVTGRIRRLALQQP